jgi:hypothetical protein
MEVEAVEVISEIEAQKPHVHFFDTHADLLKEEPKIS